jgi:hypothetical protein
MIPPDVRQQMAKEKQKFQAVRYELEIGLDAESNEIGLNHETLLLIPESKFPQLAPREAFPAIQREVETLLLRSGSGRRIAINKIL